MKKVKYLKKEVTAKKSLNNMTKKLVKKQRKQKHKSNKSAFEIGKVYFIRTCTYHYVAKIKDIYDGFLFFDKGTWVAVSGRFSNALKEGVEKQSNSELEPLIGIKTRVQISAIESAFEYEHKVPTMQK